MHLPTIRTSYVLGFLCCIGLFIAAAYFQFVKGLLPCPLCQLQRFSLGLVALCYVLAAIQNPTPKGVKRYGLAILLFTALGALFAGRQVWLQAQLSSGQAVNCLPGLEYLMDNFSLLASLKIAFIGTADCAAIDFQWLGLSMAGWSLVFFVILGLWGILQMMRVKKA